MHRRHLHNAQVASRGRLKVLAASADWVWSGLPVFADPAAAITVTYLGAGTPNLSLNMVDKATLSSVAVHVGPVAFAPGAVHQLVSSPVPGPRNLALHWLYSLVSDDASLNLRFL